MPRTRRRRTIRPGTENLEGRVLLTRWAVLDFDGEFLSSSNLSEGGWGSLGAQTVPSFHSLFNASRPYLNFNGDSVINGTDVNLAIDQIMEKVRFDFDPYDISVFQGDQDDYQSILTDSTVGDTLVMITGGTDVRPGGTAAGLAPWVDLGNNDDEIVWVFGQVWADTFSTGARVVNAIARTITHEVGHALGLDHIDGTPAGPNMADARTHHLMNTVDRDFTRDFNFQDIAYPTDSGSQNSHTILSNPGTLGPSPDAWASVLEPGVLTIQGSAGADTISVLPSTPWSWDVLVGGESYSLDTSFPGIDSINSFDTSMTTINIYGGAGDDAITVSTALGVQVNVFGEDGNDRVDIDDSSLTGDHTYDIISTTVSRSGGGSVTYSTAEELILEAGTGDDIMSVDSSTSNTSLTVFGNLGDDVFSVTPTDRDLDAIQGALVLYGEEGDDTLTVNDGLSAEGHDYVITSSTINRDGAAQVTYSTIESVSILSGAGNDDFEVESLASSTSLTLGSGDGDDRVDLSPTDRTLSSIAGDVTFSAGLGDDTIALWDRDEAADVDFLVTSSSITRDDSTVYSHVNTEEVYLYGGAGHDQFELTSSSALSDMFLYGGPGNDEFELSPGDQELDDFDGNVTTFGEDGSDTLSLDDRAEVDDTAYRINSSSIVRNDSVTFSYGTMESITLRTGSGAESVDVEGLGSSSPLTIHLGDGDDQVDVSPTDQNLDGLSALLTVYGEAGVDEATLFDNMSDSVHTYAIHSSSIQRDGTTVFSHSSLETVSLLGGTGGNTFDVESTDSSTTTHLYGQSGDDLFRVTPMSQDLKDVRRDVHVYGNGGTDHVQVDDQAETADVAVNVTSSTLERQGAGTIHYSNVDSVTYRGGSGNDHFGVESTLSGTTISLLGGLGDDHFALAPTSRSLDSIASMISINGESGDDRLTLDDRNEADDNAYRVTSTSIERNGNALVQYSQIERIELSAGSGQDTFNLGSASIDIDAGPNDDVFLMDGFTNLSQTVGLLVGGPGTDHLDYSGYLDAVTVDLNVGAATVTQGIAGIEDVDGSVFDDLIFGDSEANRLVGHDGNDTLVGRSGDDEIYGGDGDDELQGNSGDDELYGQADDDTLLSHHGHDTLDGGIGNDLMMGSRGADEIDAGAGDDTVSGGDGDDTIWGRDGDDDITGARREDWIDGGAGHDTIVGHGGDDTIWAGDGNDLVLGAFGDDWIEGQAGNDTLEGNNSRDTILGGIGDDQIVGGQGFDSLSGGDGDDTLDGSRGRDTMVGDAGADQYVLPGGPGNDRFDLAFIAGQGLTRARRFNALGTLQDVYLIDADAFDRVLLLAFGGDDVVQVDSTVSLIGTIDGGDGDDEADIDPSILANWTLLNVES